MPQIIQRSFSSGEIAPALRARADINKYSTGLAKCENFFVRPQGGVYSRPGTRYLGNTAGAAKARLIPFQFNSSQTYVLVFTNNRIQFMRNGQFINAAGTTNRYNVTTTYTEAQLEDIQFTQSGDVLTLVHPDHPVRDLSRLADNNWTLTNKLFSSPSNPVPLLAPSSSQVGTGHGSTNLNYRYRVSYVTADGLESVASPSHTVNGSGTLSSTAGFRITWVPPVQAVEFYRVYKEVNFNSGQYGWIGDASTNFIDDYNIAPLASDGPIISDIRLDSTDNYPSAVAYYQQRLVMTNTNNKPNSVFMTQPNRFENLSAHSPLVDSDAIEFSIASRQLNEIRHLVALNALVIFTEGAEWRMTEGRDGVVAPATVGVRPQSYNGASKVRPAVINDTVIYVQEKGSRIRDLRYEFNSDQYAGNDLSVMSEHLFEGHTITDMAYADEPHGILWCLRDDGVLLGLTYLREHQVWGWHQHRLATSSLGDAVIESITTIAEDGRDALYLSVRRGSLRTIERLESRTIGEDPEDAFYVDSGITVIPSPVVSATIPVPHLVGQTVSVLADGNVYNNLTVDQDGNVTLPRAVAKAQVGLPYTCTVETLSLDVPAPNETLQQRRISIARVDLVVEDSRGAWVGPIDDNGDAEMFEVKPRFDSDGYAALKLKSQNLEIQAQAGWNKTGRIRIEQRDPLPLNILAVIPQVDIGG